LNSEEAEEEFTRFYLGFFWVRIFSFYFDVRRDRTLNYFSVMVKKRLKNDTDEPEDTEAKEKKSKKGKKKDFVSFYTIMFCYGMALYFFYFSDVD
jgi:transcription initiation factor TFIIF subunit alpha